jgi:class 3 adenylate cyclase/pSer/pThr/pTyr-binding forkhead associated (FHA) protein
MTQPHGKKLEDLIRERARLDAELERFQQLLTILFIDIAGSTRFYDQRGDLAGLVMVQKCNDMLFPVVEEHKGIVVKTIGDAILARFEDTPAAVRCAVAMQRRMADYNAHRLESEQIHIRAALNLGLGLIKGNDVFGDVVNVASRIESATDPDQICISPSVFEQIQNDSTIPCRQKAAGIELKGKAQKLDLYEVVWRAGEKSGPAPPRPSDEQLALATGLHTNLAALARPEARTPPATPPPSVKSTRIFGGAVTPPPAVEAGVSFALVKMERDGTLGQRFVIDRPGLILGGEKADLSFPADKRLSSQHARFTQLGDALYVEDLGSETGIFLRLSKPHPLQPGDILLLGRQLFRFEPGTTSGPAVLAQETSVLGTPPAQSQVGLAAELILLSEDQREPQRFPLTPPEISIGRSGGTYSFPDDRYLSSSHARIVVREGGFVLEDLNSTNGSFLRIRKRALVRDGDTLLIGEQLLRVVAEVS